MTAKHLADTTTLNNGVQMPWFGLGVWQTKEGEEVEQAVTYALGAGYRHIDTAAAYKNEQGVGNAVRKSGIAREDLFITTKLWNADQGYDTAVRAFEESNRRLGLEYVDLYLIHWPVKGKYKDSWRALEKLYKDGLVRAIGVSNFHIHHLEDLLADAEVVPTVNQVECHPLLAQTELRAFCADHKIQFEAWSPLMQGNLNNGALLDIAKKYNKTPAQVVLRWDLQHGIVTIPKSIRESRIVENAQVFDFELSREDMATIDGLNENRRFGPDPDNFNF
ncbi:aldo/keto reductase [Alicyclobacillus fastidiosus]|uniref:Aldo/keto reductase n=1 Tax=Alicyclobacillus fastidiosus TaxID=392011 RepID=A0ABY6ZDU5_9BACL|nr:aldo/keto reductase [Alicyclobacillus fastidiosus]WAH41026.1 aldo/keto reductase [Alicyclobacillus fastidiosus]GMA62549.1 glyoxal reductase [Alicyclobacillus fastidiosus]